MTDGNESPFLVQLQVRQIIDGKLLILKNIEEFSLGKDLLPTIAFAFNNMKRVIEKKVLKQKNGRMVT